LLGHAQRRAEVRGHCRLTLQAQFFGLTLLGHLVCQGLLAPDLLLCVGHLISAARVCELKLLALCTGFVAVAVGGLAAAPDLLRPRALASQDSQDSQTCQAQENKH